MELTGELIQKGNTVEIKSGFTTRQVLIKYIDNSEHPQDLSFELYNNKCSLIDEFKTEETLKVSFDLRSRTSNKDGKKKYFTHLVAWKFERVNDLIQSL